jgi:hypothetical protein
MPHYRLSESTFISVDVLFNGWKSNRPVSNRIFEPDILDLLQHTFSLSLSRNCLSAIYTIIV